MRMFRLTVRLAGPLIVEAEVMANSAAEAEAMGRAALTKKAAKGCLIEVEDIGEAPTA